jgi:hypothetical protein
MDENEIRTMNVGELYVNDETPEMRRAINARIALQEAVRIGPSHAYAKNVVSAAEIFFDFLEGCSR